MTESIDTITNYRQSDSNNDVNPVDLFVIPIHYHEDVINEFGLLDDDDDNLTLLDLKFIPKPIYDLTIFDELEHQCNAVLLSSNCQQKPVLSTTTLNDNSHSSNLMTTTMINDYERRFQCSLRKLTIPSWYTDPAPSPKISNKPPIVSSSHYNRETHLTPEIVHVQRPHSYRSYRSSLGTSPSPSLHSWHPNHMMDGMNLSSLLPSSSSTSRRHNKHEKGIERVTKSSRWYQPTQFIPEKKNDQPSTRKLSKIQHNKSKSNHYDIPKVYNDNNLSNRQNLISDKNIISGLSVQQKRNNLIDDIHFDGVENTNICKKNNDNIGNKLLANDKQHIYRINSNGFQTMPLANEKTFFGCVELEEVTDEEENAKQSSTNNINIPSTVGEIHRDERNMLLEHIANNLVDSILNDVLHMKNLEHDDDKDTGVRELSDDENELRELDENDMNDTDEFIVFPTNAEAFNSDNDDHNNPTSTGINRGSLNRLYTFSRTNDDGTINSKISPNQDSPTPTLMIIDKEFSTANSLLNTDPNHPIHTTIYLEHDDPNNSLPIYRSHIQKRQINLGRYYDGMMRATTSQLPTHDLRCNLPLNNPNIQLSSDGVNEETVRKGRLLLDSIPNPNDFKKEIIENIHHQSTPVRSILKNTRFALSDEINQNKTNDHILKIEEKEKISPRKIITTTITEEYRRIQRKIIEEIDEGIITTASNEEICRDSDYSTNQEQNNTQQLLIPSVSISDQSPYELLSECYSGYSPIRNGFLKPIKSPLTSNVSSFQSTTDEAYESEPTTTSPRSPTISSSTATTSHIHPDLEHEFEYASPPPPIPDRCLKPAHLRPPPPPPKPRTHRQQQQQNDPIDYSNIKKSKNSPLTVIKHLLTLTTSNDSTSSSARTLSSRHYCGSLPQSNETTTSPTKSKTDETSRKNSKTLNGLNSSTNNDNNQQITFRKSSTSSSNKIKSKNSSSTCFEEATNGLAIRLPATISNEHDSTNKKDFHRTSTSSSTKRTEETTQNRRKSENLISDRSSVYETSV